ncbi:MAG: hypothetical protein JWP92_727 [Caulobacter sp.]|nr:hypothetical protein [Caulobacter sp.]
MTTDTPSKTTPAGSALSLGERRSFSHVLAEWPVAALIASVAMLAAAHAFETFGKLAPCTLCLKQREVYWAAAGLSLLAVALSRTAWSDKVRRPLNLILTLAFLYGAGLAAYHAGAEWKWWPGPTTCAAGGAAAAGVSADALAGLMNGAKIKAPACDEAAWVFAGLSMAGWNALISLGLAALSLLATLRKGPAR